MKMQTLLSAAGRSPVSAAAAIILAAAAVVLGVFLFRGEGAMPRGAESLTYEAVRESFTITLAESGSIESRNRVVVKSEVGGQQTIIFLIPEGTMVEEGDLLVELDSNDLRDKLVEEEIELENAEAELISARENLAVVTNQAEADIAQAELDHRFARQDLDKYREGEYAMSLKQAESKITLARAELQQAEDRLSGSRQLFENRYISETELESDQLAKQRAQMDLELAIQEKELLETYTYDRQIAQLESDVEQTRLALDRTERKARANIAQAEARLSAHRAKVRREQVSTKDLRDRIENCRIKAPTNGMVVYAPQGNRWNAETLEEGMSVRERQELIYLPTAKEMSARIDVHESMLNKLEIGQRATLTVDALPGEEFTGSVAEIGVMPEDGGWRNPDLKQYRTIIDIDQISSELRSGMTCKAEILVAHFDRALTVPVQSVLRVGDRTTVFTPVADGGPVARPVEVGMDNNRKIQILAGLEEGARVLLNPPLAAGERARPRSPAGEAEREGGRASREEAGGDRSGGKVGMAARDSGASGS
ncbi:MAG: efflux RND transporter periplasmic adaptor subunit [Puniceicoccaceae bacterium]